jgi:L-fuculose-phosphate aldolase
VLSDAEMTSVLKRFKTYGKQAADVQGLDASQLAVVAPVKREDAPVAVKKSAKPPKKSF